VSVGYSTSMTCGVRSPVVTITVLMVGSLALVRVRMSLALRMV
jgi:hypothetical protein